MDEEYKSLYFQVNKIFQKFKDNKIVFLLLESFFSGLHLGLNDRNLDVLNFIKCLKLKKISFAKFNIKNLPQEYFLFVENNKAYNKFWDNKNNSEGTLANSNVVSNTLVNTDKQNKNETFSPSGKQKQSFRSKNKNTIKKNISDKKLENYTNDSCCINILPGNTVGSDKTNETSNTNESISSKDISKSSNPKEILFKDLEDIKQDSHNLNTDDVEDEKKRQNHLQNLSSPMNKNFLENRNEEIKINSNSKINKIINETNLINIDCNNFENSIINVKLLKDDIINNALIIEKRKSLSNDNSINRNINNNNEVNYKYEDHSQKNLQILLNEIDAEKDNPLSNIGQLLINPLISTNIVAEAFEKANKLNKIENVIAIDFLLNEENNKLEESKKNFQNLKEENFELGKLNEILEREINLLKSLLLINNLNNTNTNTDRDDQRQYYNKNYFIDMCNDNNLQELVQDDVLFKKHKTLHTLMIKIKNIREQLDLFRKEFEEDRNRFLELMHDIHYRVIDYFQKEIKTRRIMEEKVSSIKKLI